jgi:hypothetical protein
MSTLQLCAPAMLYLVLSLIWILLTNTIGVHIATQILKVIFMLLWTFVLNELCNNGFSTVSWILVLLPFVIMLAMIAIVFEVLIINQAK